MIRRLFLTLRATLIEAMSYAQNLALYRIAYGTSGENPSALWLGVERGFYRKHGVNVEVLFMRSGPLAMSTLAASEVQMAFTSSNNVLNGAAPDWISRSSRP